MIIPQSTIEPFHPLGIPKIKYPENFDAVLEEIQFLLKAILNAVAKPITEKFAELIVETIILNSEKDGVRDVEYILNTGSNKIKFDEVLRSDSTIRIRIRNPHKPHIQYDLFQ